MGTSARQNDGGLKGLGVVIVLLAIAVVAVWVGCQYWGAKNRETSGGAAATATAPVELVSEGRIILGGMPRAKTGGLGGVEFEVLKNSAYIVGYSEQRKTPLWSSYRVTREQPYNLERPKGNFITDNRTAARVTHHDFTGSGYDRGHMTPNSAIAKCFGAQAQIETFLLSNICPQAAALNQKVWEELEKKELVYALKYREVWMTDGPVFADRNGGTTRTLRSGIAVPAAFYKILVEDEDGTEAGVKAFAVIMPQTVEGTELPGQFVTSISEVEKETGLEFLWKLSPEKQKTLKEEKNSEW